MSFRVSELQVLLGFVGGNKSGRKLPSKLAPPLTNLCTSTCTLFHSVCILQPILICFLIMIIKCPCISICMHAHLTPQMWLCLDIVLKECVCIFMWPMCVSAILCLVLHPNHKVYMQQHVYACPLHPLGHPIQSHSCTQIGVPLYGPCVCPVDVHACNESEFIWNQNITNC